MTIENLTRSFVNFIKKKKKDNFIHLDRLKEYYSNEKKKNKDLIIIVKGTIMINVRTGTLSVYKEETFFKIALSNVK